MTAAQHELPALATPGQVSEYLGVPVGTLRNWRYRRTGPRFVKVENHVRYRRADVERYLAANTTETTGAA
ncbi:helix-turn-helix domain-containing protein [Saccharothrix lopnurensis]|uniref:Helix-turn-helix domain-containing protein n=1 Tax=Saccharothrix lopnurensis TaxID=1670621 RepID=A0ABW1P777_9PSEU